MDLSRATRALAIGVALFAVGVVQADPAPFDLAGPTIDIEITRGAQTLPVAQVPNLLSGDRLRIKAELSATQSAHYLMVAAFLRGATNPPPLDWFHRCKTWTARCAKGGLNVTVPEGAQQFLVLLAPETGGDFKTLVNAVRGRPGAFVRISQDLTQATLDHSRLDTYLAAVRRLGEEDPSQLKEAAPLLARSLAIKVDEQCLEKLPVLQAPCLAQGRESLILDVEHSASLAQELTSGPASDLAMDASNELRAGSYGPVVGSIFDIAKLFDSLHTARYQYLPALTSAHGRKLALMLNAPPSFYDPKSVLLVALSGAQASQSPLLHPVNPNEILCARKDPLILPVEGAPLLFSTDYAHDLVLRLRTTDGSHIDLPARPDAAQGGIVVNATSLAQLRLDSPSTASLRGQWGFDPYEGPSFTLADAYQEVWRLAEGESADLIVGRVDTVHLHADSLSCLKDIVLQGAATGQSKVEWKRGEDDVEIKLPLQAAKPGPLTLLVRQFGRAEPERVALHAFAEAGHLETFTLHAGDIEGLLTGNRLDEVQALTLGSVKFTPGTLSTNEGKDELVMLAQGGLDTRILNVGNAKARVTLKDGRTFNVTVSVDSPRPSAVLISKTIVWGTGGGEDVFRLTNHNELPLTARLEFSLRARSPAQFTHDEQVEVATADGLFSAILDLGTSGMMLESSRVAVATLDPTQAFGSSAFGALRFRRVVGGVAGKWRPLITLVRLPKVTEVDCPAAPDTACSLRGSNLFLLDALSTDSAFTHATRVPDGFTEQVLEIPHPMHGKLYVRLRDDPRAADVAILSDNTRPDDSTETAADSQAEKASTPQPAISPRLGVPSHSP